MLFTSLATLALAAIPTSFAAPSAKKCVKPQVRHEWRSLSKPQRAKYLAAVNCVTKLPHNPNLRRTFDVSVHIPEINPNSSLYDDFAYLHIDLNRTFRGTGLIFAWHRWFTWMFEKTLQDRCGYDGTVPYWDWSSDAADVYNSDMWDDDPVHGLGGWGRSEEEDWTIHSGAFKDLVLAYPSKHHLRRNYTLTPYKYFPVDGLHPDPLRMSNWTFTQERVDWIMTNCVDGDYGCFQSHGEGPQNMGGGVHTIFGGDMGGICPATSAPGTCMRGAEITANDPIFFLHHSNLDRVWNTWQEREPANKRAFYGGSIQNDTGILTWPLGMPPNTTLNSFLPADGLFGPKEATVEDVISTTDGILCYTYDKPASTV